MIQCFCILQELAVENMPLFLFNTENIKPKIQMMSLKVKLKIFINIITIHNNEKRSNNIK